MPAKPKARPRPRRRLNQGYLQQLVALAITHAAGASPTLARLTWVRPTLSPHERIGAFNFVRNELMYRKRELNPSLQFHVDKVLALLQKWARQELRQELREREKRGARR